jgi:hypothetical protein
MLKTKRPIIITQNVVQYGNYYYHYHYHPLRIVSGGLPIHGKSHEKSDKTDDEKELSKKISSYRAKKTLKDLILCNLPYGEPKFLTLTYRTPQFNDKQAKLDFKNFIKRLKYHTKIYLRYIAVPEEHNSLDTRPDRLHSYHFHILVFDLSYLSARIYSDVWRHGFIKINRIDTDHIRVANYIAKYLTKSSTHIPYSRRFLASRNCVRSKEVEFKDIPVLEFLHTRNYNRFTGGTVRCDIYKNHII